jgi:hypothetical protein
MTDQKRGQRRGRCRQSRRKEARTSKIKKAIHKLVLATFITPIMVVVYKYGANFDVVHYLWTAYQSPWVINPYEKLDRSNLWIWFTPKGELWPNYLQVAEQGTSMKHLKQHLPILKEYPTLQNELVTMLQKMKNVG